MLLIGWSTLKGGSRPQRRWEVFQLEKLGDFYHWQVVVSDYREVENKHSKKMQLWYVYILYHFVI